MVKLLLEAGARVDAASGNGYERVVKMSLEAGASIDAPGGRRGSAPQTALQNRHTQVYNCYSVLEQTTLLTYITNDFLC